MDFNSPSSSYSKPTPQHDDDYFYTISDPNEDESAVYADSMTSQPNLFNQFSDQQISVMKQRLISEFKLKSDYELMHLSRIDIQKSLRINELQVAELLIKLSRPLCSDVVACTALDLFQDTEIKIEKLCFGCPIIDKYFRGGVLSRGITEIVGEAGSGKSQLCYQLAVQAQLPLEYGGLEGGCLYISTENFSFKRLSQIYNAFRKKYPFLSENLEDQIIVNKVPTIEDLWTVLGKVKQLKQTKPIKLIVIDSIAALFRHEYNSNESIDRAKILWRHANSLKLLSEDNTAIVVVNQVSDFFHDSPIMGTGIIPSARKVIPALGLTWSNCVNSRILVSKTRQMVTREVEEKAVVKKRKIETPSFVEEEEEVAKKGVAEVPLRKMDVLFSSHLPNLTCYFYVDSEGIKGIEDF